MKRDLMKKSFTRKAILVGLVLIFALSCGCKTTGGQFDLDQAIAITQITLTVAEQGLEIYELHLDREATRDEGIVEMERKFKLERIAFLREQLTELMKVRAEKK